MSKMLYLTENIRVAANKYDYIINIIKQTQKCKNNCKKNHIRSQNEERRQQKSDIDIAVYGTKKPTSYLKSAEFRNFNDNIFAFNNFDGQYYDILYFAENNNDTSKLMINIRKCEEIYSRFA